MLFLPQRKYLTVIWIKGDFLSRLYIKQTTWQKCSLANYNPERPISLYLLSVMSIKRNCPLPMRFISRPLIGPEITWWVPRLSLASTPFYPISQPPLPPSPPLPPFPNQNPSYPPRCRRPHQKVSPNCQKIPKKSAKKCQQVHTTAKRSQRSKEVLKSDK